MTEPLMADPKVVPLADSQDYLHGEYSFTMVAVECGGTCPKCGQPTLERHSLGVHHAHAIDVHLESTALGYVEACRNCDADCWLFVCHGPKSQAARARAKKALQ